MKNVSSAPSVSALAEHVFTTLKNTAWKYPDNKQVLIFVSSEYFHRCIAEVHKLNGPVSHSAIELIQNQTVCGYPIFLTHALAGARTAPPNFTVVVVQHGHSIPL